MHLKDFTPDVARNVMELWKEHLGLHYFGSQRYFEDPEQLSSSVINPRNWLLGRYEDRIGSRWTEDSKLFVYNNRPGDDGLRIEAYVQAQNLWRNRVEAEKAEETFNRAVMEYIRTETLLKQ